MDPVMSMDGYDHSILGESQVMVIQFGVGLLLFMTYYAVYLVMGSDHTSLSNIPNKERNTNDYLASLRTRSTERDIKEKALRERELSKSMTKTDKKENEQKIKNNIKQSTAKTSNKRKRKSKFVQNIDDETPVPTQTQAQTKKTKTQTQTQTQTQTHTQMQSPSLRPVSENHKSKPKRKHKHTHKRNKHKKSNDCAVLLPSNDEVRRTISNDTSLSCSSNTTSSSNPSLSPPPKKSNHKRKKPPINHTPIINYTNHRTKPMRPPLSLYESNALTQEKLDSHNMESVPAKKRKKKKRRKKETEQHQRDQKDKKMEKKREKRRDKKEKSPKIESTKKFAFQFKDAKKDKKQSKKEQKSYGLAQKQKQKHKQRRRQTQQTHMSINDKLHRVFDEFRKKQNGHGLNDEVLREEDQKLDPEAPAYIPSTNACPWATYGPSIDLSQIISSLTTLKEQPSLTSVPENDDIIDIIDDSTSSASTNTNTNSQTQSSKYITTNIGQGQPPLPPLFQPLPPLLTRPPPHPSHFVASSPTHFVPSYASPLSPISSSPLSPISSTPTLLNVADGVIPGVEAGLYWYHPQIDQSAVLLPVVINESIQSMQSLQSLQSMQQQQLAFHQYQNVMQQIQIQQQIQKQQQI